MSVYEPFVRNSFDAGSLKLRSATFLPKESTMRKSVIICLRAIVDMRATVSRARDPLIHQLGMRAAVLAAAAPEPPVLDHLDAELEALHHDLADAEELYDATGPTVVQLRRERDELAARLHALAAPIPRAPRGFPGLDRGSIFSPAL